MTDSNRSQHTLTDEQVEGMIAKAVTQNVPDLCQQAACAPITPLAMVDDILPRQFPRRRVFPRLAAAAVLLLVIFSSVGLYSWFSVKAVVSLEINPHLSLSLNRFEYVLQAQALNDDAAELLEDLSLERLKLDTALDALMGAMNRKGYLKPDATVSVFVDGKNEEYNQHLYEQIGESLEPFTENLQTAPASGEQSSVSETAPSPDQLSVSETAPSPDQPSVSETAPSPDQPSSNEKIPAQTPSSPAESTPKKEETAPPDTAAAITAEQAKQIALQYAGLDGSDVVWEKAELGEEDGVLLYELEFRLQNTEYDCEIRADGTILTFEQEQD